MNLDKAFGELRSLIHGDLEPQAWSARAWALIQQAHAFDQSHYEAIWRPYLEAFNRWDVPLGAVRSSEKLEEAIKTLDENEQILIKRHHYYDEPLTIIALDLGLSLSWCSRMHTRAIEKLRDYLSAPPDPPDSA